MWHARRTSTICQRLVEVKRQQRGLASVLLLPDASDNAHAQSVPSDANSATVSAVLDYLRVERGLAKLTISAYTSDIAQFAEFLGGRGHLLGGARRADV